MTDSAKRAKASPAKAARAKAKKAKTGKAKATNTSDAKKAKKATAKAKRATAKAGSVKSGAARTVRAKAASSKSGKASRSTKKSGAKSVETKAGAAPHVSIIIPVYNEEAILQTAVVDLVDRLKEFDWTYELVLAENGSRDRTVEIGQELAERFPQVKSFSLGEPNYGKALRRGILEATGEFVVCDEIDLCDTDFYRRALNILENNEADLVVGSKLMGGAKDERPFTRHAASIVINGMLRVALGFKGTDTHGLKAFRRTALVDVARSCLVDKDLFASEFVIRAERTGVRNTEVPIRILEKRAPSINLFRRVPRVLKDLGTLFVAIRIKG